MISRVSNHSLLVLPHIEQTISLTKNLLDKERTLEKDRGDEDGDEEEAAVEAVVVVH